MGQLYPAWNHEEITKFLYEKLLLQQYNDKNNSSQDWKKKLTDDNEKTNKKFGSGLSLEWVHVQIRIFFHIRSPQIIRDLSARLFGRRVKR